MDHRNKCTYRITVAANKGAPTVQLKDSTKSSFNFQWIEWQADALTSILPATNAAPLWLGTYTGSWPNPIKTFTAVVAPTG
jgi:hypothetical protein